MLPKSVLLLLSLVIELCEGGTVQNQSGNPPRKGNWTLIGLKPGGRTTERAARARLRTFSDPTSTALPRSSSIGSGSQAPKDKGAEMRKEATKAVTVGAEESTTARLPTSGEGGDGGGGMPPLPRDIRMREQYAGGFNCHPKWYPYFAYILRQTGGYCAGTLLSSEYVLTAGHCCYGHQITGVYAGYFYERNTWDQFSEPINVIIHGQYDNETFQYDACIIKVNEFEVSDVIKYVRLDAKYTTNAKIFSVGYATNRSMDTKDFLQIGTMPCIENIVLSEEDCKRKMSVSGIEVSYYDPETMICTEPVYKRSDKKMEADAGGPLIMSNHQIGISSFVLATRDGYGLSFHAQVDAVHQFINAYLEGESRSGESRIVSSMYITIFSFTSLYLRIVEGSVLN